MKTKPEQDAPTPYAKALYEDRVAAQERDEQPTPTPWHVAGVVRVEDSHYYRVAYIAIGGSGAHIARAAITGCVSEAEARANARVLVAAVNEHAALKTVEQAAHALMMTPGVEKFDLPHYKLACAIRDLAKVRGGGS